MQKEFKSIGNLVSPERLWSHHRTLCREIGPRLLGTEGDRRAAGYIESHFARCGYDTSRQEYPCPSWEHRYTEIKTVGGLRIRPPEGGACMFSLPCSARGELEVVRTEEELRRAVLKDKVCLLSGELANMEFRAAGSSIQDQLAEKEPLALLVADPREDTYNTKTVRNPEFNIPVCAVSGRSAAKLAEERGVVSVNIDAERFSSSSWNLFGSVPGTGDHKIRIFAHYDTTADSPGSKDNASGTAVVLEAAEALWRSGLELPVEFIAFGAEEYGRLGSKEYVREFPGRVDATYLAVNIDSVGCCGTSSQVFTTGELPEVESSLAARVKEAGDYHKIITGVPDASDDTEFRDRGVPAVYFHDTQPFFHHSPLDIPRFMSLERLEDIARIVAGIAFDIGSRMRGD